MTILQFLAEWALRSSILILSGALLLRALHVKDASIRLTAWTAVLCASLAIPALTAALPRVPLTMMGVTSGRLGTQGALEDAAPEPVHSELRSDVGVKMHRTVVSERFGWAAAAVTLYVLVAIVLLLRLCVGWAMCQRLLRSSRATNQMTEDIEIRESDRVPVPVTLGIVRPSIVLPGDWSQWDGAKLDAVLAHERSHIRRHDPKVQLLSALHRVLLWHNPLSWFLHSRIVRVAEEASDDAALAVTHDRTLYAELLLGFMQRGVRGANWLGVPMARYGRVDDRIHRILEGKTLSRGVTRWSVAAILALGSPVAYVIAAAHPAKAPQIPAQTRAETGPAALIQEAAGKSPAFDALPQPAGQNSGDVPAGTVPRGRGGRSVVPLPGDMDANDPRTLIGLGQVAAYTVTVKPRVDGELMSVSFNEGDLVQRGQVLASIDPRPFQLQLLEAEGQLARDQAQITETKINQHVLSGPQVDAQVAQLEGNVRTDQARVDSAKLQLIYAQVTAPITGVAGLRLVDPGNIVHAADATGIVIINQLQPISVLFTIAEDKLPQVLARVREGASFSAEAWDRSLKAKFATGRLTAVDNQIDPTNGTAKLRAVFDNKDGALFPNQFVNVRLLLNSR